MGTDITTTPFNVLCPRCSHFQEDTGVCKKFYFDVRAYPAKFHKRCNGDYFKEDTSRTPERIKSFHESRDQDVGAEIVESNVRDLQMEVNSLLLRGIIFSIFWLAGVGSLISIRSAIKARHLIKDTNSGLQGMGRVWWCFIIGGLGIAIWFPIMITAIINRL